LTTIAAVVLFAGCGGGSPSGTRSPGKTAGTSSVGGRRVVSAKGGAFRTVVPSGFTFAPESTQYYASRPAEGGRSNSLIVIREPLTAGDVNAVARRTLLALSHERYVHQVRPSALSINGERALAVSYVTTTQGRQWHVRQVFVGHGEWVYYIRMFSPGQYALASGAFDELISNWQWQ
jgi:hypothetical protein